MLAVVGGVKAAFAADSSPASPVATSINPAKIVDLTYPFDATTFYWPTEHPFTHEFEHDGIEQPGGYFYADAKYADPEHGGTHMDAPRHFNSAGMTVDQVPLTALIGPAAVIDYSARAANDRDTMLTVDDINRW